MAKYSINNILATTPALQAMAAAYKSLISITSPATVRRGKLFDIMVGTSGTPANNAMEFDVARETAAATGTASTPVALDTADAAALTVGLINATAEGTVTANTSPWYLALNQQASYRWSAAPGSEILWPAVSASGLRCRARSAVYTGFAAATFMFEEQ